MSSSYHVGIINVKGKEIMEKNSIVIPDRSNEIIITGENCILEILSLATDAYGRRHILIKSHPNGKGAQEK